MKAVHWRLFPKYATLIIALVAGVLLASGAVSIYFSYLETRAQLVALQFEKAQGAATRIEQYMLDIEHQLSWTALPRAETGGDPLELRRIDYLKLLRQAPAITEVVWIDNAGLEQLRVSRLAMDAIATGADLSQAPKFTEALAGKTFYGPVYFSKGTEPYMTISRPAGSGGVTAAEVNLKFVWDVVSRIKIGEAGLAYVVDADGTLIAHPDISLVLKHTDLSTLPQVAALKKPDTDEQPVARDPKGAEVFTAHAAIPTLGWTVFVESPRAEAYAPLYATILRTGLLLLAGLLVATAASFFLARALVRPIRSLQDGAARLGAGELEHRIEVRTGDELESLAGQFNQMGADLRASYAGLERKVEERTSELTVALAFQTATSEILRVISESPTDEQPVFDAILRSCERLFGAVHMGITLVGDDEQVQLAAQHGKVDDREAFARTFPVPLSDASGSGLAILERRVVQYPDLDDARVPHYVRRSGLAVGTRSVVLAPLLWEGRAIGTIFVGRPEAGPFSDKDVSLLKTFADQAVIAIQNARLFNEIREALEQQRASAEVLGAIGHSVADAQPVFDSILRSCERLFRNSHALIDRLGEDGVWRLAAYAGPQREALEGLYPVVAEGQAREGDLLSRKVVHFPDVSQAEAMNERVRRGCEIVGCRSLVVAPMVSEEGRIGTLMVGRHTNEPFTAKDCALLQTFADQAVIAVRNARLIHEIRSKGRELEIANQHKSEFLANMSHELRTPLNAVIGFSEVLTEQMFGPVNPKQLEYLHDIHSSGHHLLSLINDILDLSKIEAGRMELDLSSVNLALLLDNSATLVRERALRQGLALKFEVDERLGDRVVDPRKLKQIVINLLSNAVKFTPAGGQVTLRARALDHAVEIAVIDTGVGIAPDQQALVFEEFRQASGDYMRKTEGSGLGLALARRFVELHGGTIRLESTPGIGSTFAFILPERTLEAAA